MSSPRWSSTRLLQRLLRRIPRSALTLPLQIIAIGHLATSQIGEVGICTGPSMLPTLAPDEGVLLYLRLPFLALWNRYISLSSASAANDEHTHLSTNHQGKGFTYHSSKDLSKRLCNLPLAVGDMVVATSVHDPGKQVCKRILGLPGDRILIDPRMGAVRKMIPTGVRIFEDDHHEHHHNHHHDDDGGGGGGSGSGLQEGIGSTLGRKIALPVLESDGERHRHQRRDGSSSLAALRIDEEEVEKDGYDDGEYFTVPPGHVWLAGDNLLNSTDSRDYGPVPMGCLRGKVVARLFPLLKFFPAASTPTPPSQEPVPGHLQWLPMAPHPP